jgi:cyclopropane fatty-acyl-phospholipid synthase-like methyltransferase
MKNEWQEKKYVKHYNSNYSFEPAEISASLKSLKLTLQDTIIDFGCGSGEFLYCASSIAKKVVGVELSPHQIILAKEQCKSRSNIDLIHADFLNCELGSDKYTKGFARKSLHHLDDAQKKQFFEKISDHFDARSLLLVEDGIFTFKRASLNKRMPTILDEAAGYYGPRWKIIRKDFIECLNDEFPTGFDVWKSSLKRGGFSIIKRWQITSFYGGILARKECYG